MSRGRVRYCLRPGSVKSKHDGEVHFVDAPSLARLYGLNDAEWQVHHPTGHDCSELVHLSPKKSGNYRRPAG